MRWLSIHSVVWIHPGARLEYQSYIRIRIRGYSPRICTMIRTVKYRRYRRDYFDRLIHSRSLSGEGGGSDRYRMRIQGRRSSIGVAIGAQSIIGPIIEAVTRDERVSADCRERPTEEGPFKKREGLSLSEAGNLPDKLVGDDVYGSLWASRCRNWSHFRGGRIRAVECSVS